MPSDSLTTLLINRASNQEPKITEALNKAVTKYGGHLDGLDYRLKGWNSTKRKIETEVAEKGYFETANGLYDLARYTSVSEPDQLVEHYNRVIKELEKKGYSVKRVKNTLGNVNAPYRGINCVLENPNGYKFELQFHTQQSLDIKEVNHKLYEKERLDDTSAEEKKKLRNQMAENARQIESPKNIDKIHSFDKIKV